MADAHSAVREHEVELVARALLARGSTREGVAMLRGAVARDAAEEGCRALLTEVAAGHRPSMAGEVIELDLHLVDRWIRDGRLVEALALLGGTAMGSLETGHEWANLLGELLAPVPVEADDTLRQMHRELLTGGASVALTLLEERTQHAPALPAWALRRMELLRWMLLDNASTALAADRLSTGGTSLLALAIREPLDQRDFRGALDAARRFAAEFPEKRDASGTVHALETIVDELEKQAADGVTQMRTLPMYGHPAAAMQLRMGNLPQVCTVYQKLMEQEPDDHRARQMLRAVQAVLLALRDEELPLASEEHTWDEEATMDFGERAVAVDPLDELTMPEGPEGVRRALESLPTQDLFATTAVPSGAFDLHGLDDVTPLEVPPTSVGPRPAPEESGRVAVGDLSLSPSVAPPAKTEEMASADQQAELLVLEGRLEEAEAVYRGLARMYPQEAERHLARANDLRVLRLEGGEGVVVRSILPVK